MTLQWLAGDDGGFPQRFWVSCGEMNSVNVGQSTTFNATGLVPNTQYTCEVYGESEAGEGPPRSVRDITNRE